MPANATNGTPHAATHTVSAGGSGELGILTLLPAEVQALIVDHLLHDADGTDQASSLARRSLCALMYTCRLAFQLAAPRLWLSIWFASASMDSIPVLHRMTQSLWVLRDSAPQYAMWIRNLDLLALDDHDADDDSVSRPLTVLLATVNVIRLAIPRTSSALGPVCRGTISAGDPVDLKTIASAPKLLPNLKDLIIYTRKSHRSPCFLGAHLASLAASRRANLASININLDDVSNLADLHTGLGPLAQRALAGDLCKSLPNLSSIHVSASSTALLALGTVILSGMADPSVLNEASLFKTSDPFSSSSATHTKTLPPTLTDLGRAIAHLPTSRLKLGGVHLTHAMVAQWSPMQPLWSQLTDLTLLRTEIETQQVWQLLLALPAQRLSALTLHRAYVHDVDLAAHDPAPAPAPPATSHLPNEAPAAAPEHVSAAVVPDIPCPFSIALLDLLASPALGSLVRFSLEVPNHGVPPARALAAVMRANQHSLVDVALSVHGSGGRAMDVWIESVLRAVPLGVREARVHAPGAWVEVMRREEAEEVDRKEQELEDEEEEGDEEKQDGDEDKQTTSCVLRGGELELARVGEVVVRTYARMEYAAYMGRSGRSSLGLH